MSSEPEIGQSAPAGVVPPTTGPPTAARPRPVVAVGRIVEGTVSSVADREVEVRLVDGRTGVVPRAELPDDVRVGDVIEAALLARDDPKARAVLSRSWAVKQRAWERIEAARATGEAVSGPVTKVVKGGVVVDLGLRAFLPVSLFREPSPGAAPVQPKELVGTEVEALVVDADRSTDRVVLSVRDLDRRRRRTAEREVLRSLEPGATVSGTVSSIVEHGALVDLGGLRGLVHRSELSWAHVDRIEEEVSVGEQVDVVVLDVNRSKRRISLSLRATRPDPLLGLEKGAILPATVARVVEYGVFVRLDDSGAEGLVHISELSDVPGYRPDQLVTPGEQLMVKVLEVDRDRRRVALSVRRVLVDDQP